MIVLKLDSHENKRKDRTFQNSWHRNIHDNTAKHLNKNDPYKSILKIFLLLLMILTLLIIYRWGQKMPDVELLSINKENNIYTPDTLLSPKLLIQNKSNAPITIEAFQAKKDVENSNIIILEKPKGNYKASNKTNIYFYSVKGILNSNKEILQLMESVEIESSDGTKLVTNNIIYNYKNNIVKGEGHVTINGKWGILKGKGFSYNLDSSIINLTGSPKISLNNNRGIFK